MEWVVEISADNEWVKERTEAPVINLFAAEFVTGASSSTQTRTTEYHGSQELKRVGLAAFAVSAAIKKLRLRNSISST